MKDIIAILTKVTQIVPVIDKFVENEMKTFTFIENVDDDYDYQHDAIWSALQERLDALENKMTEIDKEGEISWEIVHHSDNSFTIDVKTSDYETDYQHEGENVVEVDYKYSFYKKWSI